MRNSAAIACLLAITAGLSVCSKQGPPPKMSEQDDLERRVIALETAFSGERIRMFQPITPICEDRTCDPFMNERQTISGIQLELRDQPSDLCSSLILHCGLRTIGEIPGVCSLHKVYHSDDGFLILTGSGGSGGLVTVSKASCSAGIRDVDFLSSIQGDIALRELYGFHDQITFNRTLILVKSPVYRKDEPNCCPTGGQLSVLLSVEPVRILDASYSNTTPR